MLKTVLASAVVIVGTSSFALDAGATTRHHHKHLLANGRCKGVSYGTGSRHCGTKVGGPVGGNPNKN